MEEGEEERDPIIDSPDMELMASLTMEPKMGKRALGFNCRAVMSGGRGRGSISGVTRAVARSQGEAN